MLVLSFYTFISNIIAILLVKKNYAKVKNTHIRKKLNLIKLVYQ